MKNIITIIICIFYSITNIVLANNLHRWADNKVTIGYNPAGAPTKFANQQQAVEIIQHALTEWQNVCGIKFEFAGITNDPVDNYTDKRVVIAWRNIETIAETVTTTQANKSLGYDEYVDASIILSSNPIYFQSDNFRRALLQQLGIVMGIGDSDNPFAFMNSNYNESFIYFSHLMPADIEAAQALYGWSKNFFAPPIFSPPPISKPAIVKGNFLFISEAYKNITASITEITDHTRVSLKDSVYFKFDYLNFPVGKIKFITVNPKGYIHTSYSDFAPANGSWSAWVATANQMKRFPGTWHFYIIGDGKTLVNTAIEVKTPPPVWNHPPSATLYIANTDDPLTVTATVHSVIDPENDNTTATWHVPGKDVKVENFKGQVSHIISFPKAGTYQIFVKINNVLKSRTITVPTAPTPKFVGNLAYGRNSAIQHVFMRDENNDLRELWWGSDFSRLENLSAIVGGQKIAGDPIYYREDNGTQHIFVRDINNHLREWSWTYKTGWKLADLGIAVGNLVYFNKDGVQHIFARDTDNHLREWWRTADSDWHLEDLSLAVGGQTIASDPFYFNKNGEQYVLAIDSNGDLRLWLWTLNSGWHLGNLGKIAITGKLSSFNKDGKQYIFARGTNGHLLKWWWTLDSGWHFEDLSGQTIAGNPVYFNDNGVQHIFARDTNNHLREWWKTDGGWHLEDLSLAVGGQTIVSDPVYYNKNGKQQVFALDSEGKIRQWWWTIETGWKMFVM